MAKSSRKKQKKAANKKVVNTSTTTQATQGETAVTQASTENAASSNSNTAEQATKKATPKKTVRRRGGKSQKKTNYTPWIIGAVVIAAIFTLPIIQREYKLRTATGDFAQLIREGRGEARRQQIKHRDLGRGHVAFGTEIEYNTIPATSGRHYGSWISPGYYIDEQEERELVHSLEHGHIVAYYSEEIGTEAKEQLIDWTGDFRNTWGGFVLVPYEGAGSDIIFTAWAHTLKFNVNEFNPAVAAAFIDIHRGRGPENPIR